MCLPWTHKWKEVDRSFYEHGYFTIDGTERVTNTLTRLTYKCEKCPAHRQVTLEGMVKGKKE